MTLHQNASVVELKGGLVVLLPRMTLHQNNVTSTLVLI